MSSSTLFPSQPSKRAIASGSGKSPSLAPHASRPRSLWRALRIFQWLVVAVIALAWYLRARNPHFSSAYMDETIYILTGRMFLNHHFESPIDHYLNYSFGWYWWPILAAWADRIAGIVGVRELGAAMGTVIVVSVYGFTKRVFSSGVALAAALIFALLGPAILVSRVATRDIGSLFFFSLGLWMFVIAWQAQKGRKWPLWLAAALLMFAAFLCKYLIALYFPFLALLTIAKGRRAILGYFAPLATLCAAYAIYFRESLIALWHYGRAYGSLKAPAATAVQIYFTHRWDFWILALLALLAWFSVKQVGWRKLALFCGGAAIMPLFQLVSRADYDYWKHINYSFLFLVPLAAYGLLSLLRRAGPLAFNISAPVMVCCLATLFGWMGSAWHIDQFVFWPNTEPITAYFEGRLAPSARVLIDDTVLRYYFSPPLHQWQMVDPFYFRYNNSTGESAYAAATRDGYFDFVVLDGGIGSDAREMDAAIAPQLGARYRLVVNMPDPTLGQAIRIYERENPPAAVAPPDGRAAAAQIAIVSPAANSVVQTNRTATTLRARVHGISPGDYVVADVFTDRWYTQTGKLRPGAPDGDLSATIYLAGEGREQCYHIVRVRLFDSSGHLLDSALNFNVARANANGAIPACR